MPSLVLRAITGSLTGCPAHFPAQAPAFEGMLSAGVSITARHVISALCAGRYPCDIVTDMQIFH